MIRVDAENATITDLQQSYSSKGKKPVWLYAVGGLVGDGLVYLILKRFGLIKKKNT